MDHYKSALALVASASINRPSVAINGRPFNAVHFPHVLTINAPRAHCREPPETRVDCVQQRAMEVPARALKVELQQFGVSGPSVFENAFLAMIKQRVEAVTIQTDTVLVANAGAVATLAANSILVRADKVIE